MSYESPIRHYQPRIKLSPERLGERISTLIESAEIVESSIRDLMSEVQLSDSVIEKISYSTSLTRRQISCLKRAKDSADADRDE